MKSFSALTGLAAGLVLFAGAAMAQNAPKPQASQPQAADAQQAQQTPASQGPTDVKPIGDWTVRCFPVASASPCDMYEELDDKNTRQRVLGVSLAYAPATDRHVVQIAVPLGVSIAKGLVIQTDNFTSPKLNYRRCDPNGCYVEMVLPNDMVQSLSRSGPNAAVKIVADNNKSFDLRFSLNGFSAAHDQMASLARQKAKTPPAPAAPAPQQ